ncbi:MAG: hypothetical protein ACKERG_00605 [Candidatus Hodgkinia cicadicola]
MFSSFVSWLSDRAADAEGRWSAGGEVRVSVEEGVRGVAAGGEERKKRERERRIEKCVPTRPLPLHPPT